MDCSAIEARLLGFNIGSQHAVAPRALCVTLLSLCFQPINQHTNVKQQCHKNPVWQQVTHRFDRPGC